MPWRSEVSDLQEVHFLLWRFLAIDDIYMLRMTSVGSRPSANLSLGHFIMNKELHIFQTSENQNFTVYSTDL